MKIFLYCLLGLILGLLAAFVLVLVVGWLSPLFNGGAGRDNMTQGLMGFIVLVFAGPILGLTGCVLGYRKAKKNTH